MKVTLIADKENTAIHKLCVYTKQSLPQHDFRIVCVHPKRPSGSQIKEAFEALDWCDVVDWRYWRSAELLRSMVTVNKPQILTHYNPYDIQKQTWTQYKINIVVNSEQAELMRGQSYRIPLPVDLDFWEYKPDFDANRLKTAIMVANRIEAKKGVLPVAQATKKAGMKLILVGRPSDPTYLQAVLAHSNVEYHEGVSDEELRDLYHQAGVHVCNSQDHFESGTMPILESIACGTPVMTRKVGHVPDIFNGRNMVVRHGLPENVTEMVELFKQMQDDPQWCSKMREDAWWSIKNRCLDTYGRKYSNLYWKVLLGQPLVSVIIPTFNRVEVLAKNIAHLAAQDWEHFEVIVCDDGSTDATKEFVMQAQKELSIRMTIKYLNTARYEISSSHVDMNSVKFSRNVTESEYKMIEDQLEQLEKGTKQTLILPEWATLEMVKAPGFTKTYGIAHARNMGILAAEGTWLMFVDDRIAVEPDAIKSFMEKRIEGSWQWGVKDGSPKGFVENFSFIDRFTMVKIGGFSEMITQYGGMTQEVRKRAELNGVTFSANMGAKASALTKSSSRWRKLLDIAKSKAQCYSLGYE